MKKKDICWMLASSIAAIICGVFVSDLIEKITINKTEKIIVAFVISMYITFLVIVISDIVCDYLYSNKRRLK